MEYLQLIVTGTGRCGTVFMAKFLTSIGIPCCHEGIFNYENKDKILDRISNPKNRVLSECSVSNFNKKNDKNWVDTKFSIADSSYLAVPYLNELILNDLKLIHVIRNPIDVISSYVLDFDYFKNNQPNRLNPYNKNGYEQIIWQTLPELKDINNQVDRACYFYVKWNELIESSKQEKITIKIENFNKDKLFIFLNKPKTDNFFNDNKANTNSSNKKKLNINDIKDELIKKIFVEKYIQYGYAGKLL